MMVVYLYVETHLSIHVRVIYSMKQMEPVCFTMSLTLLTCNHECSLPCMLGKKMSSKRDDRD